MREPIGVRWVRRSLRPYAAVYMGGWFDSWDECVRAINEDGARRNPLHGPCAPFPVMAFSDDTDVPLDEFLKVPGGFTA